MISIIKTVFKAPTDVNVGKVKIIKVAVKVILRVKKRVRICFL
jgi:hypothetical protein